MPNELSLGNIREFANRSGAFEYAKLNESGKLDPGARSISGRIFMAVTTPVRWVGRALCALFSDPSDAEIRATRKIATVLRRAYGPEFVNRMAGDMFDEGSAVTSRQVSALLEQLDAEVATVKTRNTDAAKHLLNAPRPSEDEDDGAYLFKDVDPNAVDDVRSEVLSLLATDPRMRKEDADVPAIVQDAVQSAVRRRQVLQNGRLPSLRPTKVSLDIHSAVVAEGRRVLALVGDATGDPRLDKCAYSYPDTMFNYSANLIEELEKALYDSPLDDVEEFASHIESLKSNVADWNKELDKAIKELRERRAPFASNPQDPRYVKLTAAIDSFINLKADIAGLVGQLDNHLLLTRSLADVHPLSEKEFRKTEDLLDAAALRAVRKELARVPAHSDATRQRLTTLESTIAERIRVRGLAPDTGKVYTLEEARAVREHREGENLDELASALCGVPPSDFEVDEIFYLIHASRLLEHAFLETRNKDQAWGEVRHDFRLFQEGVSRDFSSKVTPVAQTTQATGGNVASSLPSRYTADGVRGICSDDRANTKHATNLAVTEFSDGTGVLFRGVRHGTYATKCDPSKLSPAELNQLKQDLNLPPTATMDQVKEAVEDLRVLEGVSLALQGNIPVLDQAIQASNNNAEVPTLHICSINLQTGGDTFEDTDSASLEGNMINRQTAAFQRLAARGQISVAVVGPDGTARMVPVKVKVVPVNFPVNPGATGKFLNVDVGSRRARTSVLEALQTMTGSHQEGDPMGGLVAQYLRRQDVSEQDKAVVRELVEQCRHIANGDQIFKPDGTPDFYALPARLNLLAFKIGMTPMFNCKSGKDRTGHLDLETKFLASRIAMEGRVPKPGLLTPSQKTAFSTIALKSGNLEMQRYNTGIGGYKTFNQERVWERLSPAAKARYAGGGKMVEH